MRRGIILLVVALLAVGGCNFGSWWGRRDYFADNAGPPATQPADARGSPEAAGALATKTAAYARELEELLESRRSRPPAARPASPPVVPFEPTFPDVRWTEPPVQLALGPPQRDEPAAPAPPEKPAAATEKPAAAPQPANVAEAVPQAEAHQPAGQPAAPAPVVANVSRQSAPVTRASEPSSDELEASLARRIADYPRDLAAHLDYQLIQLLRGRPVPELDRIAGLPMEDRELLAGLMDALANFRAAVRDGENRMFAEKARPLVELSDRLRPQASLRIGEMALCSRVDGFGVYQTIDTRNLPAGRETTAVLYCEVENFSSRLNDQRMWETNLTQAAALYNERGQRVWEDRPRPVTDQSRNRRRDFFIARMVKLPAALPPGRYRLLVTMSDQQAGRVAENSLTITLSARQEEAAAAKRAAAF